MSETQQLAGKTAIVTGASSGIGLAISQQLAGAGAHVYMTSRTKARVDAAVQDVVAAGDRATGMVVDVRDTDALRATIEEATQADGGLHVMVNNAGLSYPGTIADGDPTHWREMFETNVLALLVGSQAAIRAMRASKSEGHIVTISSIAARRDGSGVYGSTKAAVNSIVRQLRDELEDDPIRVVNIMPGAVVTNFGRNFPAEQIRGFMQMAGVETEFNSGDVLPEAELDKMRAAAKPMFAAPDDIARAVLFAVTQPVTLNVIEMEVRPQRQLQF